MNLHEDKPLWVPSAERIAGANVTAFRRAAAQRWGVDLPDYDALYDWSVAHPEQFWVSVWEGDGIGSGVSTTISPVSWLAEQEGAEFSILYGIDARAGVLSVDAFLEGAEDEYLLVRDAYLQRRRCQIVDCSEEVPEYLLPDYEFEVPDLDSMRR